MTINLKKSYNLTNKDKKIRKQNGRKKKNICKPNLTFSRSSSRRIESCTNS